ncbi:pseudouridylate synthase 1 homolog isoform X1 [Saccostrea echinata]|uniref:pseudouridylate synthase 1 homolog isoform X1 n=2 Tax=Saccostrea echinata TaxID=191078 RepID=UPI002A8287AC|nr:pseudouridylate synthase 1 homolog isoform X1 [Saccostrea echinata]
MIRRFIKKLWGSIPKMSETVTAPHMKRKSEDESESRQKKVKTIKKEPVPQMQGNPNTKRKVAVLIAYNGKGYHGIQRNPPYPSIEEELLKALLKVGAITQDHYDKPGAIHFQRAARTDKHVSAASNIISLKMVTNVENFLEKVNQELPNQIRIFGFKRTTKGFDCKTQCTGRTYMYVLPTYALAPEGMKISEEYRITDEILVHANDVLKLYQGTHNFHNFTSGIKPTEQKAKRYIISFECGKPYIREGLEFVTCKVRGQSFMLHHIRKMIGLMIAIVKGCCKEDVLQLAWGPEKVDVPKAPGLGLLLDELYFDGYNKKWGRDGLHEPVEWTQYEEELEKFKEEYILPEIYKGEKNDKVMWEWLKTLHMHSFDVESNNRRHRNQDPYSMSSNNGTDGLQKNEQQANVNQIKMSEEHQEGIVDMNREQCEEPNLQEHVENDSDGEIKQKQDLVTTG